MTLPDRVLTESIIAIQRAFDDNLHLLSVTRIKLNEHEELVAMIDEHCAQIHELRGAWKRRVDAMGER